MQTSNADSETIIGHRFATLSNVIDFLARSMEVTRGELLPQLEKMRDYSEVCSFALVSYPGVNCTMRRTNMFREPCRVIGQFTALKECLKTHSSLAVAGNADSKLLKGGAFSQARCPYSLLRPSTSVSERV